MRPFVATLLKCNKCNSGELGRMCPTKMKKISVPTYTPDVSALKNHQDFLMDLIGSVSEVGGNLIDISEADLYLFVECDSNDAATQENLKIVELLYGIDIVEGTLCCSSPGCNAVRKIKNSILFYEE